MVAAAATGTYTLSALNRRPTTAAAAVYAASRENRAIAVALNHKRIGANGASEQASERARARKREERELFRRSDAVATPRPDVSFDWIDLATPRENK